MASNASERSGLLTAGGILSLVGGAFELVGGGIAVGLVIAHRELFRLVGHGVWGGIPGIFLGPFGFVDLIWLIIVGVPIFALGIVAIIGGVSTLRRKNFGLSLAGAICALPTVIFGIVAITLVSVSRREFGTGGEQSRV